MRILILIVSFILDSIVSNFFPINSLFLACFSLMAIVFVYPLFKGDKKSYYISAFCLGLAYDLIYTDTVIFQAVVFLFMAYLTTKLGKTLSDNYMTVIITAIICVIIYRSLWFFSLVLTGNISFNIENYFASIYRSLILNIIYALIISMIVKLTNKRKTRRSRMK